MTNPRNLPRSLLLLCLAATSALASPAAWPPSGSPGQTVLQPLEEAASSGGTRGAVASESKVCSQIGIDLLAKGGNAVDAWVGTQLCVGVVAVHHSGIGGGGFALIRDQDGRYTVVDYRETAPAAASEDMFQGNVEGSVVGGLAAAVPGELRGLEYAHHRWGVLSWRAVVEPAARVALEGFAVTEDAVRYMEAGLRSAPYNFFLEDPAWAEDFAPGGVLAKQGDIITRKRYGTTLQAVAEHGADVFYTGAIAKATVDAARARNGTMTLDDLARYRIIVREPVTMTYGGYQLWSSGAPSSGAVCLSILKTMEGYEGADKAGKNLTLHRLDEAMRFAYGAHQALGDPDFVDADIAFLEAAMVHAGRAAKVRSSIDDNATQPVEHYDPDRIYTPDSYGTSHVSTADAATGLAVSSTTTVNTLFGSLLVVPETGLVLNNEMNDFSIPGRRNEFGYEPAPANYIRPGKRPLSSITPVIAERLGADGSDTSHGLLFAVVGAAGGSRIISATAQVLYRLLQDGESLGQAMTAPRFHDQLMPNRAVFEYAFDNGTVASMVEKGHEVAWMPEGSSAVQGILWVEGAFDAVGETRQRNSGGLTL